MHDTKARRCLHREQPLGPRLAQIVVETAGPVPAAQNGERRVQIGTREHRPGDDVARNPGHLVVGPYVIDGLHQPRIVDGEGVPRQQARRVEAREADTVLRLHAHDEAVAVELDLVVLVVGDDARSVSTGRDQYGGAARLVRTTLIASARKITPAVPQEDVVEVGAGALGDTLDLAHVVGKCLPRGAEQRLQPVAPLPVAFDRLKTREPRHDLADGARRRFAETATHLVGVACDFYSVHEPRIGQNRYSSTTAGTIHCSHTIKAGLHTNMPSKLSLISDDYGRAGRLGRVHVVVAPEDEPPFDVDALAVEEDTHLLLSSKGEIEEPQEGYEELVTAAADRPPSTPGSVLVRKGKPLELLAIVHDIDCDPTWREEWIASSINGIVEEAEWRRLEAIAVPLIGTRHGSIEMRRVALWLGRCLSRTTFRYLKRIWIIAPAGSETELMWALRTEFAGKR